VFRVMVGVLVRLRVRVRVWWGLVRVRGRFRGRVGMEKG